MDTVRKCLFSILLFCSGYTAGAQTFSLGVGLKVFNQPLKGYPDFLSGGILGAFRVTLKENEKSSLSLDLPLVTGLAGNGVPGPDVHFGLLLDAPLLLNYNFGAGSLRKKVSRFGYFAGAGFGYHYNSFVKHNGTFQPLQDKVNGIGPAADIGFRMGVSSGINTYELHFSYMKTTDASHADLLGICLVFNY